MAKLGQKCAERNPVLEGCFLNGVECPHRTASACHTVMHEQPHRLRPATHNLIYAMVRIRDTIVHRAPRLNSNGPAS